MPLAGKPFMHRDGTWYMISGSGAWIRLTRIKDDLFDKHGKLVHHLKKPEKQS
jgi:hypothetical protein